MSSNIDEFKTTGLTLINIAERYLDVESIQNQVATIGMRKLACHPLND